MRKTATVQKIPFLAPDVATKIIPSPTDGWDAISPLAEMDPKRAPILNNWVPRPGYVELRGGYIPWDSTLGTSPVETLMTYRYGSTEKFFAASDAHIYDVSSGIGGQTQVSGLTNARWQYTNFSPLNSSVGTMFAVNGSDPMLQYNGTVWSNPSITGTLTNGVGVNTANFIHINAQKRRLWFTVNNSTLAAFMPTDAIAGAIAGNLDFAGLWSKGGFLVGMSAWTIDGGSGPQDYALFLSSRGQVTIYSGTDPTLASNWVLVGTFDVAPPIGRRCFLRVGSDLLIITQQGVIPISQALPFDPSADRSVAITARIQNAMAAAALNYQSNFGWELIAYPNQQLTLLNVPLTANVQQNQFAMNTLTGAWAQFTGWNANCFGIYKDNLYFGGNKGDINQAYIGQSDLVSSIAADMQCAFNWFDDPGRVKRMTMIQPLMNLGASLTPTLAVDTDFATSSSTASVSSIAGTVLWDKAIWDQSLWPLPSVNYANWLTVNALGHALALRLRANVTGVTNAAMLSLFDQAQFDAAAFDEGLTTALPIIQFNAANSILEFGGAI